jgi:hypothetical protein
MLHVAEFIPFLVLGMSICVVESIPMAHQHHESGIHQSSEVSGRVSFDEPKQVATGETISSGLVRTHLDECLKKIHQRKLFSI